MTPRKKLLCIAPVELDVHRLLAGITDQWDVRSLASLAGAERELRNSCYLVGLIIYNHELNKKVDIDGFLRRHSNMQWIGVFKSHDLDDVSCRDLVVEHLCDYHTVPVDPARLAYTLGHAHGWAMLSRHEDRRPAAQRLNASTMVGNSDAMARLRGQIERVAKVTAPVLIWGESGSGKELAAQAIHAQSDRVNGPFIPINCGAISPSLIHSELFGYERGAFTGATAGKAGLIESANCGTLFLDEIGDLPKDLQANLLRFLQEKTICRLGSTRNIQVNVRVVAASHVQLQRAVESGAFREDLYYRLAVLPVTVPPLRERRDDLVNLAEHFFHLYANEKAPRLKGFSNRAIAAVLEHEWPGNVRELINRVRRALVMSDERLITPLDLGLEQNKAIVRPAGLDDTRVRTEQLILRECLDRSGQNVSRAARDLGVSRTTIYRLLSKHGMRV